MHKLVRRDLPLLQERPVAGHSRRDRSSFALAVRTIRADLVTRSGPVRSLPRTTRCGCLCSNPLGIESLHSTVSRGIIRDGSAATCTIERQIPTRRSGRMALGRPRNLQHPMFGRFALVDDRPPPRLQGMRPGS